MTSTSVGWVLLDGQGPEATILDHDVFDIQSGANGAEINTSLHAAAARGAKAIATTSGHKVGAVHVTWTEDLSAAGAELLKSLAELGFDNVHSVSLSRAAQAWGIEIGRESEHAKTSLCILEPDAAAIMVIATGAGTVRTAVTESRESGADLVEWLRTVFRKDGWLPESLYLIGAHADLDEATQLLADALPIPVSDSVDTQLALARGAALATVDQGDNGSAGSVEPVTERTWRVPRPKKPAVPADTVAAPAASTVDTVATQVIETPRVESRADSPRRERPWLVAHAKKLTIGVGAVAVFGAALSLAAGSALNVENASTQAADSEAAGASVTSASVHTVPAPTASLPVPQLQPLAAVPPPAPETLSIPAAPAAVVAPEPVAIPAPVPTVSTPPPAPVPVAAPVAAPVAPPPAAPLAAPVAPPPAAPAPIVPPPAAPAPIAPPPPPPADPAYEPPPPDPVQQVLSPLFSGLP